MLTEDIVQNVFIKLFENLENLREKEFVATWIYTTARNEVFDHLRRKKRKPLEITEDDFEFTSEDDLVIDYESIELKKIVLTELEKLPEEQREVYLLKEYSGLSYKEIADIQKIDEVLVKSRLFKTRQKLIKRISKLV